jgi:ankyrin repeat protein
MAQHQLFDASYLGDLEKVKDALSRGASIDGRDGSDHTALHMAVAGDHIDIVRFLVDRGASFRPDGKGRMPTTIAALCEVSADLCDYIVEAEAAAEGAAA